MRAIDIMSDKVTTIRATQSLADAIDALSETNTRHLPVLGDAGQVVGMVSDRDLRSLGLVRTPDLQTLGRLHDRLRTAVSSAMSADVATVGPQTDVKELIDTMLEAGVGAVPVVDDVTDELVGIVSYVDVLRALRDAGEA